MVMRWAWPNAWVVAGVAWGYYRDGKEKGGNMEAKVDTIHAVALQR
jgi:hypothetical protein